MKKKPQIVPDCVNRLLLKDRAKKIKFGDVDAISELMIDVLCLYVNKPTTKSEFIKFILKLMSHDYTDVRSPLLNYDVKWAFERCLYYLAIVYVPKQPLLPGCNYE